MRFLTVCKCTYILNLNMSGIEDRTKIARGKRTSVEQMDLLVNYISENKIILAGKTQPSNTQEIEEHWKKLTEMLNNTRGATKTVKEWKTFFSEWKSKTRKKAREIKVGLMGTGGGPAKNLHLNNTEERLISILGKVVIDGTENLPQEMDPATNNIIDQTLLDTIDISNIEMMAVETCTEDIRELTAPLDINPSSSNIQSGKQNNNKRTKKFVRKDTAATAMEKAAESYAESTRMICNAMIIFAESLNKIANAFEHYAQATEKLAEANKNNNHAANY